MNSPYEYNEENNLKKTDSDEIFNNYFYIKHNKERKFDDLICSDVARRVATDYQLSIINCPLLIVHYPFFNISPSTQ